MSVPGVGTVTATAFAAAVEDPELQELAHMHVNKATVALAAKIARIVWVILSKPGATYLKVPSQG